MGKSQNQSKSTQNLKESSVDRANSPRGASLPHYLRNEIKVFEGFILWAACLGTLEFGFTYTTILCYLVMTVAFAEMINLQARSDKEEHIMIKTKWVEWYFFATF